MQCEALRAAMNPGLSVVIGPPGTGKTDTAVQMISNLVHTFPTQVCTFPVPSMYLPCTFPVPSMISNLVHTFPTQRTLIITHSNQALNDIFEKLLMRDIDERCAARLYLREIISPRFISVIHLRLDGLEGQSTSGAPRDRG